MRQHKINEIFPIKLDTKNTCFGSADKLKLYYFLDSDNIIIETSNVFTELTTEVKTKEYKIIENSLIGNLSIKIENTHTFEVDDLIKIRNNYYFIKDINDNILYLNKSLKENVFIDDLVTYSNFTGIYTTNMQFLKSGIYNIIIRNIETFKSTMTSIEIVDILIEEKIDSILSKESLDKTFI